MLTHVLSRSAGHSISLSIDSVPTSAYAALKAQLLQTSVHSAMASVQADAELRLKDLSSSRQPNAAEEFWSAWTKALSSSQVPEAAECDERPRKKQKRSAKAVSLADNVSQSDDVVLASIDINLVSWLWNSNDLVLTLSAEPPGPVTRTSWK